MKSNDIFTVYTNLCIIYCWGRAEFVPLPEAYNPKKASVNFSVIVKMIAQRLYIQNRGSIVHIKALDAHYIVLNIGNHQN